jgi:hypothetical protein
MGGAFPVDKAALTATSNFKGAKESGPPSIRTFRLFFIAPSYPDLPDSGIKPVDK